MPLSKKILLVDDEKFILQLVSRALTRKGFLCITADSVESAFSILQTEMPDIILSDYSMPGMDGFEFRRLVLADRRLSSIPFVFFTSFADEQLMQQGLDMSAVDYIDKNTPIPLVVSKLNNILDTIRKQHERSISEIGTAAQALNLRSVPTAPPAINGFSVDFLHESFENYPGGDFIDFIEVDERFTFAFMGDVMGKKWGAWFFSFCFLSYIRSAVRLCVLDGDISTASILNKINKVVFFDPVLSDVLSTLSLLMINHQTGNIHYSGAGDLPLLLHRRQQQEAVEITSGGLLLGVLQEGLYDEQIIEMEAGDQLIAVSDGMIDYSVNGEKKSDFYNFKERILPLLGERDTFQQIKSGTMFEPESGQVVDDRSLIYIEKTRTDLLN